MAVDLSILYLRCEELAVANAVSNAISFNSLFEMLVRVNPDNGEEVVTFNSLFEMPGVEECMTYADIKILSILYLRCSSMQIQSSEPHCILSILYLRCGARRRMRRLL